MINTLIKVLLYIIINLNFYYVMITAMPVCKIFEMISSSERDSAQYTGADAYPGAKQIGDTPHGTSTYRLASYDTTTSPNEEKQRLNEES